MTIRQKNIAVTLCCATAMLVCFKTLRFWEYGGRE